VLTHGQALLTGLPGAQPCSYLHGDLTWLTIKDFRLARRSDLRAPGSRRANLRTKPGL